MLSQTPHQVRDLFKHPLSAEEIRALLNGRPASDWVATKSPRFKALGLAGQTLSDEQWIQLMAQEPYLIRRPALLWNNQLVVGINGKKWRELSG